MLEWKGSVRFLFGTFSTLFLRIVYDFFGEGTFARKPFSLRFLVHQVVDTSLLHLIDLRNCATSSLDTIVLVPTIAPIGLLLVLVIHFRQIGHHIEPVFTSFGTVESF